VSLSKIYLLYTEHHFKHSGIFHHHFHHWIALHHAFHHWILLDKLLKGIWILQHLLHHLLIVRIFHHFLYFLLINSSRDCAHILRMVNNSISSKTHWRRWA